MRLLLRALMAFVLAAIAAYVIATLFFTSANLIRLSAVGAEITVADAVRTFLFDVRGMAPSLLWTQYGSLIFIGFAIAFPVAAVLRRFSMRSEAARWIAPTLYPLAGATAIALILILSYQTYEVFAFAGARGVLGSLAQCLAGAVGGYLFQIMLARKEVRS
ncbi:MAG: hypothetical protein C0P74_010155 [Gammaproteobacteria bacterium]